MSVLPIWARKPFHNKEVIATSRGWMVAETGEYLKIVKNLKDRLIELYRETDSVVKSIEPEITPNAVEQQPTVDNTVVDHQTVSDDDVDEVKEQPVVAEQQVQPEPTEKPVKHRRWRRSKVQKQKELSSEISDGTIKQ